MTTEISVMYGSEKVNTVAYYKHVLRMGIERCIRQ